MTRITYYFCPFAPGDTADMRLDCEACNGDGRTPYGWCERCSRNGHYQAECSECHKPCWRGDCWETLEYRHERCDVDYQCSSACLLWRLCGAASDAAIEAAREMVALAARPSELLRPPSPMKATKARREVA